ncbi:hypothetical protein JRQ81_002810 [Phrynocephalus forsythii]|uniref:Uncharacterized protein n=1 Tax=Phrynocephalus forsythii TaxID=171643 RepID=A0A9Q1AX10_9SAUR|nr:hypothetical protein JRQ81_002810 [Phrynocephalus forsythii]
MSEKLSRCRKELTAAIDRAMEDMSMPSPDSTVHDDVPVAEPSISPTEDLLNDKREATPLDLGCSQPSSPDSPAPEKENPQLRPNLVPLTVTSRTPCTKREPLISKENTWLHPPILVADRPFLVSLEDNERRREHVSKTDERSMKSDVSVAARDASPDSSKDLADECADDPAIWPPEMLQQKSVLEKELQELSQLSSIPFSLDESSFLDLDVSSFRNVLDHSPEDEAIIETLLDMEEEYTANSSNLRQLH